MKPHRILILQRKYENMEELCTEYQYFNYADKIVLRLKMIELHVTFYFGKL